MADVLPVYDAVQRQARAEALYTETTLAERGVGWFFVGFEPSGNAYRLRLSGGSLSYDSGRPSRRTISGLVLLPDEARKVEFVQDRVGLYMVKDTNLVPMGLYNWTESIRRPDVILDPEDPSVISDILNMGLSDEMVRLQRNDGPPEMILAGADPSQEMKRLLDDCGIPRSIAGATSTTNQILTWDGSATHHDKITQLADLAGHRAPWVDFNGVIRSVNAGVVEQDTIDLLTGFDGVEDGSITITENYLTAPNRVIVSDTSGDRSYSIIGVWDAPGSAPHNATARGYITTYRQNLQGLASVDHANKVAETLGEQFSASTLSAVLAKPTNQLDGPAIIRYDGLLWLVTSWDVSLSSGSKMGLQATQLVDLGVEA